MDADSVSHMMHYKHLITDDDYEAITAAPNDSKMNTVILQYVRAMDMNQLSSFCDILKSIENQKIIGDHLSTCKYVRMYIHAYVYATKCVCIYITTYCATSYAIPWIESMYTYVQYYMYVP